MESRGHICGAAGRILRKGNVMNFWERLQQAGDWVGVGKNQSSIADSLQLNKQTVNRWYQGGEPNAQMLLHIAKTWGVSFEWLKTGRGEMLPLRAVDYSETERELVMEYRKATPKVRDVIRTFIRTLAKAVLTVSAVIPPLMAPTDADASILHKQNCDSESGRVTQCIVAAVELTEYALHAIAQLLRKILPAPRAVITCV